MLPGLIVATAHPSAINCSIAGGSAFGGGEAGPRPAPGVPDPGAPPLPGNTGDGNATSGMLRPPNIIIAGAGAFARAGTERLDTELVEHIPMIAGRIPVPGIHTALPPQGSSDHCSGDEQPCSPEMLACLHW